MSRADTRAPALKVVFLFLKTATHPPDRLVASPLWSLRSGRLTPHGGILVLNGAKDLSSLRHAIDCSEYYVSDPQPGFVSVRGRKPDT